MAYNNKMTKSIFISGLTYISRSNLGKIKQEEGNPQRHPYTINPKPAITGNRIMYNPSAVNYMLFPFLHVMPHPHCCTLSIP